MAAVYSALVGPLVSPQGWTHASEEYLRGVRKVTCVDPEGTEVAFCTVPTA